MIRNSKFLFQVLRLRPRFIIHVGAHLGQDRDDYLISQPRNIFWVEADPATANKLQNKYPQDKVINFAIWDVGNISIDLHQFAHEEQNSLIPPVQNNPKFPANISSIQVKTITLDQLFESLDLFRLRKGWITIDIQGAELHALNGATKALKNIDYLVIEIANTSQGYAETPSLLEVEAILSHSGLYRSLSRISHDQSYTDHLFIRGSKIKRVIIQILDSLFQTAISLLHLLRWKHLKSNPFHCEKCNSSAE